MAEINNIGEIVIMAAKKTSTQVYIDLITEIHNMREIATMAAKKTSTQVYRDRAKAVLPVILLNETGATALAQIMREKAMNKSDAVRFALESIACKINDRMCDLPLTPAQPSDMIQESTTD